MTVQLYMAQVSLLVLNVMPQKKDIENMEGNLCSLALSINYNGLKALIGGDMEVGRMKQDKYNYSICESDCPKHEDCGWCDAIADGNVFACEKPYHFINLPHHSSASAYCPKMWKEGMDEGGPIATTTIFRCSNGEDLPTREMLNLYKDRCKALFITNSDGDDEKTIAEEFDGVEERSGDGSLIRF